jgi:hypothetical protein
MILDFGHESTPTLTHSHNHVVLGRMSQGLPVAGAPPRPESLNNGCLAAV